VETVPEVYGKDLWKKGCIS